MNKKNILLLNGAFKAFRKNKFSEAIVLLEKIISYRPSQPYPYFLLCVTYLLCDRFSDAEKTIKKLRAVDPDYLPLNHLQAFLTLKSASNIHPVLADYVDKLDKFPGDKFLKKTLKMLHKVKNFPAFQKNARLKNFVYIPKPDFNISDYSQSFYERPDKIKKNIKTYKTSRSKKLLIILSICFIIIISGLSVYFLFFNKIIFTQKNKNITQIDTLNIDLLQYDLIDKILSTKPLIFYYSNDEILNDFNKAKNLIKMEKYNDALMIINKISSSNANFRVKERNEFLRKFISNIEYKNYSEIPVEKIFQKPYLYRGIFIKWKGKIANLKKKDNKLSFNLLVDYKKEDKFSGVIDVYSEKDYKDIKNGDIVSIEGSFVNAIGNNNRLYLVADTIERF